MAFVTTNNAKKVHSANLYQIYAYLHNLEQRDGRDAEAEGILLYPVVSQSLDLRYRISGHAVRICTINLAQDWHDIRRDFLVILN